MLPMSTIIIYKKKIQCWDRLWASESDVYEGHILTREDGARAERVNMFGRSHSEAC